MSRKSVAVLDVRSSEIAVFVGERGVNNTFVFKASKTEPYYGYADGAFYDENDLSEAVFRAVSAVEQICGERIRELYIGVPGEFTLVVPKEQNIGFSKKRKITQKELAALFQKGAEQREGYRVIRATSMIYTTSDNRRVVDPIGISATSLSGVLSYFYCSESFIGTMEKIFSGMKIELHYLPTEFAMANYLIPSETRDEYALFLDVGYLSTSLLVLLGNGVLAQETYWVGRGQIAGLLMSNLSVSLDVATALLSRANLFAKDTTGKAEFNYRGASYEIDLNVLVESVKEGLDGICEKVGTFLEFCSGKDIDYKPLYVSGEGLENIRGALEHISKRLNRVCEQLAPDLPYYNKPTMSSRVALMEMAQCDREKGGVFNRLLNVFGG